MFAIAVTNRLWQLPEWSELDRTVYLGDYNALAMRAYATRYPTEAAAQSAIARKLTQKSLQDLTLEVVSLQ